MLIFGATTPGLEKDKIRTGCYSCGSVTFGKFALSCVAALCVCARDGHRNTGSFGKKRPKYMPFPMPNTQTFRSRITQANRSQGGAGTAPHLRPQRGPAALLAMGDLHTQSRKISGRGKNGQAGPAVPAVDPAETQRRTPPPSGFRFPLGNWRPRGGLTKRLPRAHEGFL